MKFFKLFLLCFLSISPLFTYSQNGAEIFKTKCASCHSIGKGIVVGPDLKDLFKDMDMSEEWLHSFIRSSQSLIKSGDMHAMEISDKFKGTVMPDQQLSDTEISSVLAYIKSESLGEAKISTAPSSPVSIASENINQADDSTNPHTLFNYLWISLVVIFFLIIIIGVLAQVIKTLSAALKDEYKKNKK